MIYNFKTIKDLLLLCGTRYDDKISTHSIWLDYIKYCPKPLVNYKDFKKLINLLRQYSGQLQGDK